MDPYFPLLRWLPFIAAGVGHTRWCPGLTVGSAQESVLAGTERPVARPGIEPGLAACRAGQSFSCPPPGKGRDARPERVACAEVRVVSGPWLPLLLPGRPPGEFDCLLMATFGGKPCDLRPCFLGTSTNVSPGQALRSRSVLGLGPSVGDPHSRPGRPQQGHLACVVDSGGAGRGGREAA